MIKSASNIDEQEKFLLEKFNYYQREYQPFLIVKENHKDEFMCRRQKFNEKVLYQINNQIFKVDKIKSKESVFNNLESFTALSCIYNNNESIMNMLVNDNLTLEANLRVLTKFMERYDLTRMIQNEDCINVLKSLLLRIFSITDRESLYRYKLK